MFQLRQLKIFIAAVETLSFTQAAKRVHLSQPSVTEQVRALEETVGQPLFIRQNNRLQLTPAGEKLAIRARELLALADDTFREVRDNAADPAGTIRVAAPQTLCTSILVPQLLHFAATHPDAQVAVQERNSQATAQAVLNGSADLGLVHGWPASDANLHVEVITRDMPVVVFPPGHPLRLSSDRITPDALAAFPLIVTMEGCRYREYLEALLQEAPARPRIRGVADSVPALMQMVSAGLGVSILPRMAMNPAGTMSDLSGGVMRSSDTAPGLSGGVTKPTETPPRVEWRPLATSSGEGLPICLLTQPRQPAGHVAAFIEMIRFAATPSDEPMPAVHMQYRAGRVAIAK